MDQDIKPSISVILPVYNADRYLRAAIQSILDQTLSNFELIIINDGSIDNSKAIVESFIDPRIIFIENPKNLGLIATLNKGLTLAKSNLVARMDADDIAFPERLQIQFDFLTQHPEVTLVGTWSDIINEKGVHCKIHKNPLTHTAIMYELMFGNTITHPSIQCVY